MNREVSTFIIDSFTNAPFKGNPAGVCLVKKALTVGQMQSIALELGLSETAFIEPGDRGKSFAIRYFSPKMEIPLCGHATLAAAKALFHQNPDWTQVEFQTQEKLRLIVKRQGNLLAMGFPRYNTEPVDNPVSLIKALGLSEVQNHVYNRETKIILLEIASPNELRKLKPDQTTLLAARQDINGVLITAPSLQPDYDFESRYFWPWSGTLEDPVTGGTHTFLAPYWANKLGKTELASFQCSTRTGEMKISVHADSLTIYGEAVVVFTGTLLL